MINITARRSYDSAVLGVVILSVGLSHACFVTNPKNLPVIFLYHMKRQSFQFSATQQWLAGDVRFYLKWANEVTNPPSKIAHVDRFPPNKRNFFTGLRFEVEQASRGLSAVAELLVLCRTLASVCFGEKEPNLIYIVQEHFAIFLITPHAQSHGILTNYVTQRLFNRLSVLLLCSY